MTRFTNALFGATTIQITEQAEGVYTYRFCASHDGKNFSADTWTLTLTVEDAPVMDFTFLVGQDYTGAYPTIKLYTVEQDKDGNEVLGKELENCFLYSNFTGTLPEGEAAYDPAAGKRADNYQTFYARSGPMWKGIGQAKAVLFCILVIAISSLQLKFTRSKEVQQ